MALNRNSVSSFKDFDNHTLVSIQTGLVITNANGLIIKYNLDAVQMAKNCQFAKKGSPNFITDLLANVPSVLKHGLRHLLTGSSEHLEYDVVCPKSENRQWVRIIGIPLRIDVKSLPAIHIFLLKDITEAKNKEKQIGQKEQLFQSVSRNLNEAIFRSTYNDGLLYANEHMVALFGYRNEEEILTRPSEAFFEHDEHRVLFLKKLERCGAIKNELVSFKKKNGEVFQGLLSCTQSKGEDERLVIDGTIINISELLQTKSLIQQKNEELEKLNAQLDRFFYSLFHDLRSPLTTILGICNLMDMELKSETDVQAYINMIRKSTERLNEVLENTISFSKNSGRRLQSERIDTEKLINTILNELQAKATRVDVCVQKTDDLVFYSDRYRLYLILKNIIKNALHFADPDKQTHYLDIEVSHYQNKAIIRFTDNGIGISQLHLPRIFDMFYRGTDKSKGSGVGLYIVKEALNKLKGTIKVESKRKKGTTVIIEIPNDPKGRLVSKKIIMSK